MSAPPEMLADRSPMSWEQFRELDESVPGEYIDGYLVMAPRPDNQHQNAIYRLEAALESVVPDGYLVDAEFGWSPTAGAYFVPDVMVYAAEPTTPLSAFEGIPVLVVEVLSQNRSDDLVIKMASYAGFGLPHYWIVDRGRHHRCVHSEQRQLPPSTAQRWKRTRRDRLWPGSVDDQPSRPARPLEQQPFPLGHAPRGGG